MRNLPILFSTPMVEALLDNRKTNTRRGVKGVKSNTDTLAGVFTKRRLWDSSVEEPPGIMETNAVFVDGNNEEYRIKSKYNVGDVMWVRESFCLTKHSEPAFYSFGYKAGENSPDNVSSKYDYEIPDVWKPSIHMPKEAARIFLEVVSVSVERLQDISIDDIIAEGIKIDESGFTLCKDDPLYGSVIEVILLDSWINLWKSINGIDSWDPNPYVWVYKFKQVRRPDNFLSDGI